MASNAQGNMGSRAALEAGPFVLRTLFADVPLWEDDSRNDIKINCVEYLDRNLYVGTSGSELLHFVQIPNEPGDNTATPTFILASRLQPAYAEPAGGANATKPGVQEILLLPAVGKACILCNSTVTFYSLPELSPVFGGLQVKNCSWVGGLDLNERNIDSSEREVTGVNVLLSLNRRIQVVRIGEDARSQKKIDFPGSRLSVRRDTIACIADSRSYALLEIDRQLKIPLMSISSLDEGQAGAIGQAQDISGSAGGGLMRSNSSAQARSQTESPDPPTHRRVTSLGNLISSATRRQEQPASEGEDSGPQQPTPPESTTSPAPPEEAANATNTTAPEGAAESRPTQSMAPARPGPVFLKPHIVSPTPEEFLLVTGTGPLEPGIGMFVNLDGDPTRPTVEFDRYPREIVVDGGSQDLSSSKMSLTPEDEGYVLASMSRDFPDGVHHGLEIQRWDMDLAEGEPLKYWLEPSGGAEKDRQSSQHLGITSLLGNDDTHFQEIVDKLCRRRFMPFAPGGAETPSVSLKSVDSRTALSMERLVKERELFERDIDSQSDVSLPEGWHATRNAEEEEFARRLAGSTARLAVWSGPNIWWALRNPLLLQLDAQLGALSATPDQVITNWKELVAILSSFRGRDAKSELEFLTFSFIRQRAGLLLLTSFLKLGSDFLTDSDLRAMEEILVDSSLDPRVVLSLIPGVRNEVIETRKGIWIFGGVKTTAEEFISSSDFGKTSTHLDSLPQSVLQFLWRFLATWRRKKGFGSIADENEVFRTVDAALLSVLLELDRHSRSGPAKARSVRSELYELVDHGVECFERAETLLNSYHRLFVLSRLYQSRKMAQEVLMTWRRIIEGERDDGNEFQDGEPRVREYLANLKNQALVQEYGLWLANRNPKLGVQVFAEDKGRAPKFEPASVVEMLRREAPNAVKDYLEYLVFGKGHTIYVDELIAYYLDIVINRLKESPEAREVVISTYAAYRALQPPKPTYRQFLTDNAPENDEAWHSRLRLLQLLGGSYDYDATAIRDRIASLSSTADDLLVPETIILDGRERRHENALRLLVHHLGDYDTAVAYCYRAGASIYNTTIYQATAPPSTTAAAAGKRKQVVAPKPGDRPTSSSASEPATATAEQRARLFRALLGEFLGLEDVSERVVQSAALLDRFGGLLDVADVLAAIPDSWAVETVADFLVKALRRLAADRQEAAVARALSSAQNLRVQHELLVRIEEAGPRVEVE
ncbi:hypothetical protein F4780DRAFT_252589 [Xylariomycetidae sp. FL0641]|nr:hypothetical protein F4780DRAFT_252589 [Xylariomycetidae sp. FL0641]